MRVRVRFLLDENLTVDLRAAILNHEASIDVVRVGDKGAPPFGTPDPDILLYCERERRALVTDNRKTMPRHVRELEAAGHTHWGEFEVRHSRVPIGVIAQTLYEVWGASEADEWQGQLRWIPFR